LGNTNHCRSMPSLTRKPTPNKDSTTPTLTGTLPVVNQRATAARTVSASEGRAGRDGGGGAAVSTRAGAAGTGSGTTGAAVSTGAGAAGRGSGPGAASVAGASRTGVARAS